MEELILELVADFALGTDSIHGLNHWRRVETYGLYLAGKNGADFRAVSLFAYFHDCQRIDEDRDPGHGLRGAEKAKRLRDKLDLGDTAFELLFQACAGHTDLVFSHDVTIATCWDADRLDLDRVGIDPHPDYFSTYEGARLALLPTKARQMEVGL